jgi:hypothetical protein
MSHLFDPFRSLRGFRVKSETSFFCCCPLHDEKTASLRGVVKDGKLLLFCFGCHAPTVDLLRAMGLPWSALFEGGRVPARQARDAARQAREAREAERLKLEDEYFSIAFDLDLRDTLLALDWGDDGPPAHVCLDRGYLEWRLEQLAAELKI